MLTCLTDTCRLVSAGAEALGAPQPSADELMPLVAYVTLRAQVASLPAELAFVQGAEDCEEDAAPVPAATAAPAAAAPASAAAPAAATPAAASAASRAAGGAPVSMEEDALYSHLRKTINIWHARFRGEHSREATSSDLPMHFACARLEYAELKAVLKARGKQ